MTSLQSVVPALLPRERRVYQSLEGLPIQEVIERPASRAVPDHDDAPILPRRRQIIEEASNSLDHLDVALPIRKGRINVVSALTCELLDRFAIQSPVVAFAEACIARTPCFGRT